MLESLRGQSIRAAYCCDVNHCVAAVLCALVRRQPAAGTYPDSMGYHHKIAHRYRELGLTGTVRYSIMRMLDWAYDYSFDLRYGVRTSGVTLPLVEGGEGYKASLPQLLRETIADLPIKHEDFTFVDLGSGKGRSLLVAAGFPFREVIGVELAPQMQAAAESNLERYRGPRRCGGLRSVAGDVRTFPIPGGPLVFYMYNPFKQEVLDAVLRNVRASLRREPRPVYFIYLRPVWGETLERAGYERLALRRSALIDHFDVGIYRAVAATAA